MKTILSIIVTSALITGTSTGIALQHHEKSHKATIEKKHGVSYLFVVSAEKAELRPGKDGNTLLIIKKSDLNRTIEFSDRPYRIIKHITASDMAKNWVVGSNSFSGDPPNAVISAKNMKPEVVILTGYTYNNEEMMLTVKNLDNIKVGQITNPVLVIDSKCALSSIILCDLGPCAMNYKTCSCDLCVSMEPMEEVGDE